MQPFKNPFSELSAAVGRVNANLVNKLATVEDVKSSVGTIHELRKRNSYGRFTAVGYRGWMETAYNRIDLTEVFGAAQKQDVSVKSRLAPTTTHQALQLINRKWNLELQPASIKPLAVVYDGDGVGTVTVEAVDGALDVTGSFTFKIIPGPDNIAELPLSTSLGDGLYPSGQYVKGQAQFLSYPVDTTNWNGYLAGVWTGQAIDEALVQTVSEMTGVTWTASAAGQYSLQGAVVTYAGPVRAGWDLPKPNFARVVVIQLGAACSNFAGELSFYHNPN